MVVSANPLGPAHRLLGPRPCLDLAFRVAELGTVAQVHALLAGIEDLADTVREARRLGRILIGRRANNTDVDAFLVDVCRRRVPVEVLLAQAREHPPPPPAPTKPDWGWCTLEAPAASLLGPWAPPATLADALDQIRALKAIKSRREAVLARAWAISDHLALWHVAGYETRWDYAREVLGWSKRTAQRRKRVGWALEWYPALDAAARAGLGLGVASMLATVIDGDDAARWLGVAGRVGKGELARAVEAAREHVHPRRVLARYEQAIEAADRWDSERLDQGAPSAGAPLRVAFATSASQAPERGGAGARAAVGVLEAARWWVAHVVLPRRSGFDRIKERDGHRCQNPECGRSTLRVEGHHLTHRSDGGSDDEANGVTTCRPCHLRGIHTGGEDVPRIHPERVRMGDREGILWTYAGGRRVLQFR